MVVVHGNSEFDDAKLRPFAMTKRIARNYFQNECEIVLVSGMPEGIGKTGYVNHVVADMYGYLECHDKDAVNWFWKSGKPQDRPKEAQIWSQNWKAVREHIEYLPENVVRRCKTMLEKGVRESALHWDDGGTWLNAMEFHDPFVIAFMEYLSLARSNWGMIVISTPVEEWVLKKLHSATGILRVRVKKPEGTNMRPDRQLTWKPRLAEAFQVIRYPNRLRPYWRREWTDRFIAIMPDDFYGWYKPERDKYALIAARKMEAALDRKRLRGFHTEGDETVLANIKETIAKGNDASKDFREVIEQVQTQKIG